jgi:DNA-binding response OmpR family regulator
MTATTASQRTVLVIDDDGPTRNLLEDILALENYAVLKAGHGRQALALAREHAPDVILLDRGMPAMPGAAILRELRACAATRHIPVVMISGWETPDGEEPRPDGALLKPFDIDVLLDHVNRLETRGPRTA